jgi:dihydropyrimidine dehydrogenase (NAD+) subunit PreA
LISGLTGWMRSKGFTKVSDFVGLSAPRLKTWGELDLNYKVVAEIDQSKCIHCGLCYIACEDGCHQSIRWDREPAGPAVSPGVGGGSINVFSIRQDTCVGCNMCSLVCPVEGCISMKPVDRGLPEMSWNQYQELLAEGRIEKIRPPEHA